MFLALFKGRWQNGKVPITLILTIVAAQHNFNFVNRAHNSIDNVLKDRNRDVIPTKLIKITNTIMNNILTFH